LDVQSISNCFATAKIPDDLTWQLSKSTKHASNENRESPDLKCERL
jgi:hypothetical protein